MCCVWSVARNGLWILSLYKYDIIYNLISTHGLKVDGENQSCKCNETSKSFIKKHPSALHICDGDVCDPPLLEMLLITVYELESVRSQLQFWLVAEFLFISASFTTFQDSRPITRTLFLDQDWGLFTHLSLVRCPDVVFSSGLVCCVSGDRLSWASSVSSTSSSSDCTCPQRAAAFWCSGLLWLLLLTWTTPERILPPESKPFVSNRNVISHFDRSSVFKYKQATHSMS